MPGMLCVVCVFFGTLSFSCSNIHILPSYNGGALINMPTVYLNPCANKHKHSFSLHPSFSQPPRQFILTNEPPSSDVYKVAGRVQTWHIDSSALARGTNEVKQIYTVP